MKVPSKNVVMGILFSFALLPILSCAIAVPGDYGSIAVGISIPKSIGNASFPAALREAFAPSASSRFIHPGTRRVEVVVALNSGRAQIRADASVAEGDSSASVTVSGVPYGTHEVTVSLYDAEGVLLSRGMASVAVESSAPASALVTAVPVTEKILLPGPFEIRGTVIPPEDYGTLCVYRVSIPNAGSYGLRCNDSGTRFSLGSEMMALYDANGQRIAFSSTSQDIAYSWIPAGDCYVAINAPSRVDDELHLYLDVDLRVTMSAPTVYVDPVFGAVQDRTRPFTIRVPCGFIGTPKLDFNAANGETTPTITVDNPLTVSVKPGPTGLSPYRMPNAGSNIDFKDALLGFDRADVGFAFSGAPRTFIYDPDVMPMDSHAAAFSSVGQAIIDVNDMEESTQVVVALQDGDRYTVDTSVNINRPILLLGGFSAGGARQDNHGTSEITFGSNNDAIDFNEVATDSVLDSLDMILAGESLDSDVGAISTNAKITLLNCALTYANSFTLDAGLSNYSLLTAGFGDVTLDRCSLIGPGVSFNASTGYSLNGIYVTDANRPLRITNSIISPCTVNYKISRSGITLRGINAPSLSSGSVTIAGSTISSGLIARSAEGDLAMVPIFVDGTGTINVANSLLVAGNPNDSGSTFIYYTGDPDTNLNLNRCILGYAGSIASDSIIIRYSRSGVEYQNWARMERFRANPVMGLSALSLVSTDPSRPDFLMPRASSPKELLTDGADLNNLEAYSNFSITTLYPDYLLRDRLGVERTGNGTIGYTIGAFEVD